MTISSKIVLMYTNVLPVPVSISTSNSGRFISRRDAAVEHVADSGGRRSLEFLVLEFEFHGGGIG
jgi:hypothetical protein